MVDLSKFLGERDISGLCCTKTGSTNLYLNWKESDACLYLQPLPLVATLYPFSALKHGYPDSRSAAQLQSWGQKSIAEDGRAGREAVWNLVTSWTTCTRPRQLTPRIFHCLGKTDLSLFKTCWSGFLLLAAKHVPNNTRCFLFASSGPCCILLNCWGPQEAGLSGPYGQTCQPSSFWLDLAQKLYSYEFTTLYTCKSTPRHIYKDSDYIIVCNGKILKADQMSINREGGVLTK